MLAPWIATILNLVDHALGMLDPDAHRKRFGFEGDLPATLRNDADMTLWIQGDRLIVSSDAERLREFDRANRGDR